MSAFACFQEGGLNFLMLYQGLLTVRILLSWFPQAQGVALLRPVFTASDVYLNLFRGVIPPIGGIDISPIGSAPPDSRTPTERERPPRCLVVQSTLCFPPPPVCVLRL